MLIHGLDLKKFCSWTDLEGAALSPGLNLILGDNGAGKSALGLEAPAWLLWGETIRGTSPEGHVTGTFGAGDATYKIQRVWSRKGDKSLGFYRADQDMTGQTPTETDERICRVFGTWRRFAATRVFSRRLLTRFGAATDKERKALLEEVLGLDQFERAYQWALKERGRRSAALQEAASALRAAASASEQASRSLAAMGAPRDLETLRGRLAEAESGLAIAEPKLASLAKRAQALREVTEELHGQCAGAEAEAKAVDRRARSLAAAPAASGVCPTCKRPLDAASTQEAEGHAERELADLRREYGTLQVLIAQAKAEWESARLAYSGAEGEWRAADASRRALKESAAALAQELEGAREYAARVAQIEAQRDAAVAEEARAKEAELSARQAAEVAEEVCRILGPKGARVGLLAGALVQLQAGANAVLPRLGGKVKSIKISGSDADGKVTIAVEGAGGGEYRGTSDGEQTRLDVALLLALARVSGDAGYVAFDEVFDPLDNAGLEGAAEILNEMSRIRQVVVITHNPRFEGLLPHAHRLRAVDDGGKSRLETA